MKEFHVVPNGGINTYDSIINDNQLADSLNVWWKGGLKHRSGISRTMPDIDVVDIYPKDGTYTRLYEDESDPATYGMYILSNVDGFLKLYFYNGITNDLIATVGYHKIGMIIPTSITISGYLDVESEKRTVTHTAISILAEDFYYTTYLYNGTTNYLSVKKFSTLSAYVPVVMVNTTPFGEGNKKDSKNMFSPIMEQKFTTNSTSSNYKLLYNNISEIKSISYTDQSGTAYSGEITTYPPSITLAGKTFEFNLTAGIFQIKSGTALSTLIDASAYNMENNLSVIFSVDNVESISRTSKFTTKSSASTEYRLNENTTTLGITGVLYRDQTGTYQASKENYLGQYFWKIKGNLYTFSLSGNRVLTVTPFINLIPFNFSPPLIEAANYNLVDNLTVTYLTSANMEVRKIAKCTLWSYFGGDRQGLSSGNRIFVAGNQSYPNRIWWSDSNHPYYFPEENFNDIGDSTPILALGKVFDSLIVFKANATYRIKYAYDEENYVAYFPVTEISPTYGCDMPNSVQLINNDLVWCHSKHGVLLLKSTTSSVADERVIRKISRNINTKLLPLLKVMTNHCSADHDGYYYLFVNDKVFLWDYNTSPYSFQNSDEEQKRLAWYYWEIPIRPKIAAMARVTMVELFRIYLGDTGIFFLSDKEYDNPDPNEEESVSCMIRSKAYDFGHSEVRKWLVALGFFGSAAGISADFYNNGAKTNITYGDRTKELLCRVPFKAYQNYLQVGLNANTMNIKQLFLKYEIGKTE